MLSHITRPLNRACQIFTVLTISLAGLAATGTMPGHLRFEYQLNNLSVQEKQAAATTEEAQKLASVMPTKAFEVIKPATKPAIPGKQP